MTTPPAPQRRLALVTGSSRGIGAATARALARRGHDVVVTYAARRDAAAEVVDDCEAAGVRAVALPFDQGDLGAVDRLFSEVDDRFGRLDVLVNNAGILPPAGRVVDLTAERVVRTLTVNAAGAALCAARAVQRMSTARGGKGGVVVNVSSRAAERGAAGEFVDYAMSKAAVDLLTTGLAQEVAREGIRVVGVRPGLIDTDMNAGQPGRLERLAPTVPLGRIGTPDEVAEAICWLASDAAGYVTGVTVDVSGGR
jgi:NAD(P)-dependent dehydrogenase (short-subunit alcohol dehydrogenase family)